MPALALTERIDQELNENPVLEMSEPDPEVRFLAGALPRADQAGRL